MSRVGFCEERTQTATNRWVVKVNGELDLATGQILVADARDLVCQGKSVDFDLSGITFADSAGWAGVRGAARVLEEAGLVARIVNPSPPVRKLTALLARHPSAARPTDICLAGGSSPGTRVAAGLARRRPAPPGQSAAPLPPAA
jgi:anti-anti-sigma regulatory factor